VATLSISKFNLILCLQVTKTPILFI